MTIRIAVDAMGGDFAPGVNVKGALLALEKNPSLRTILVGHEPTLRDWLKREGAKESDRLSIVHAEESISMEDHGAAAIRKKPESSLHRALTLVKEGKAEAFLSAGNSGASMAGALLLLGRLPGVDRPAIAVRLPTLEGSILILDAGANVDCKPNHLQQFAVMGSLFMQEIEQVPKPRVGLLSNGAETHKGNDLTRGAHELLKAARGLNYIGYVEGHDLFRGNADVAICDGFVGNVVLKAAEGLAETTFQWFRKELKRDVVGLLGVAMLKRVLRSFKARFDYQPYGAAPLLGVDGVVFIGHGASSEVAIQNGLFAASRSVQSRLLDRMKTLLQGEPRKKRKAKG